MYCYLQEREEAYQRELEIARVEKEKEIARLRAQQERAKDKQAEKVLKLLTCSTFLISFFFHFHFFRRERSLKIDSKKNYQAFRHWILLFNRV